MISKLKEVRSSLSKSKDGKTLASNFGYMMLLQIAGYLFPLITIPYLARVIGVDGFGKIAFAAAIVLWFQTISDWGFNYTATRDVARNRDNPEKVSEIFSNVLWARILLMFLSLIVLLIATMFIPLLKENQLIIWLTFLLVPGHIMFPEWFFQAVEKMRFITIFSLASKAIFTVMVFVFITEKEDFILQPIFMSLGFIVCGLVSMYLIVVKWKVKIQSPDWRAISATIKNSTDVFVTNIMPNFYYGFSTLLVGFYGGVTSNGLLDAGRRFAAISEQFMNVVSKVFYPYLARNKNKHSAYAFINLTLSICAFVFLVISAPFIMKIFFTPEFILAVPVLQISSLSLVFLSLRNIYGVNYLILYGHERVARNIITITSVLGFFAAFPLVCYLDYIGAALVSVTIHALQGVWMMLSSKAIAKKQILYKV